MLRPLRGGLRRWLAAAGITEDETYEISYTYTARTGGQYLIVNETSGGTAKSMLFETDGSRVTQFRSGLTNWVMAPEGCT